METLTQKQLKERLHYNKHTGIFTRLKNTSNKHCNTYKVGRIHEEGYLIISVKGKLYKAHRLAWLYKYGQFPKGSIDHINHNRNDNRISNLRDADCKINSRNISIRKDNISRVVGVSWNALEKKWKSQVQVDGKKINLGTFSDKNDAICARLHANKLYGFHANHGKNLK